MQRRALLAGLGATASLGLAGCVGDGPSDGGDGDNDDGDNGDDGTGDDGDNGTGAGGTDDGTDGGDSGGDGTAGDPVLTSAALSSASCEEPEAATVAFDGEASEIRVDGCIVGNTGCHVPSLLEPTLEEGETRRLSDDRLLVAVETVDDSGPDEACTQALTELGYEAAFGFEGALPSSVEVVHETHDGRRTVATADR